MRFFYLLLGGLAAYRLSLMISEGGRTGLHLSETAQAAAGRVLGEGRVFFVHVHLDRGAGGVVPLANWSDPRK